MSVKWNKWLKTSPTVGAPHVKTEGLWQDKVSYEREGRDADAKRRQRISGLDLPPQGLNDSLHEAIPSKLGSCFFYTSWT
ncbi:conserved hypothetical protein [Ricinus communis]|uniref:Uncharacterized protein n=1 Tax=Ricinus communis TaxID=3988 RepID=B9SLM4_RICCO|nr:conserved hypothetical protein [Ricinus communis]